MQKNCLSDTKSIIMTLAEVLPAVRQLSAFGYVRLEDVELNTQDKGMSNDP